jgi:hypothetical protein
MTVWDKIATLAPTRDAAVAVSGGETYEPAVGWDERKHWTAPPRMLLPKKGAHDLRGRTNGFLTVIGVLAPQPGDGKWTRTRWVVRCVCGDYEARRHRSIRDGLLPGDRCKVCEHTENLRLLGSKPSTRATRQRSADALDRLARRAA